MNIVVVIIIIIINFFINKQQQSPPTPRGVNADLDRSQRRVLASTSSTRAPRYVTRRTRFLQLWRSQGPSVFGPLRLLLPAVIFRWGSIESL